MRKTPPIESPDAYVAALGGWRREVVNGLRAATRSVPGLREVVKWRHLVYLADGPAALIRAEEARILLGFWRGQRLRAIEPRLVAGGRYEMATLSLREGDAIDPGLVARLVGEAVALNARLGDPTRPAPG